MKLWITLVALLTSATAATAAHLDYSQANRIVIQAGGRKKPLETFAAESLQTISGRRGYTDKLTGERVGATDLLLSLWFNTRDWKRLPIILVSDLSLRRQLGLSNTERLYSFEALTSSENLSAQYEALQKKRAAKQELTPVEKELETVIGRIEQLNFIATPQAMTIVPDPQAAKGNWITPAAAAKIYDAKTSSGLQALLQNTADAYRAQDGARFNETSRALRVGLAQLAPRFYPASSAIEREVHYNQLHPFRWAWLLYLAGFFVVLAPRAQRAGIALFLGGAALHVYGFILRCQIAGYAPVTNMYESVVWVSLGIALFAIGFALVHKTRLYLLVAAPLAVAGLILADLLPSVLNPNIGPLPPVLRDNFWLATHVLTITLGYAAFALAMALGHFILGRALFGRTGVNERSGYYHLLHRVLQLGVLLLAAGTILGGVWANYAWGRFWGWDPKETWALIALLLYIFALHGRLTGWWGNFGLSVAAVICFNGVLMAWYGVNFVLGKGLHSYGFGGGGLGWIGTLVGLELLFVAACVAVHQRRLPAVARGKRPAEAVAQPA